MPEDSLKKLGVRLSIQYLITAARHCVVGERSLDLSKYRPCTIWLRENGQSVVMPRTAAAIRLLCIVQLWAWPRSFVQPCVSSIYRYSQYIVVLCSCLQWIFRGSRLQNRCLAARWISAKFAKVTSNVQLADRIPAHVWLLPNTVDDSSTLKILTLPTIQSVTL